MGTAFVLAVVVVFGGAGLAAAQPQPSPSVRAREAFERGVTLMEQERWDAAIAELQVSIELRPTQVALLDLALCHAELRRYREAIAAYERFLADFGAQATPERRAEVEQELARLRAVPGRARFEVEPDGAEVSVDGRAIGRAQFASELELAAGPHVVEALAEGRRPGRRDIEISPGETIVASLSLEHEPLPEPEPPPDSRPETGPAGFRSPTAPLADDEADGGLSPIWFWSAAGVTLAGTIATAVLGTLVVTGSSAYEDDSRRTTDAQEAGRQLMLITDVTLGVTVAGAIAATILYFVTDFGD